MIIADKISSEHFSYDKETNEFTAEESVLPVNVKIMGPIFDNCCTQGFILIHDGVEVLFHLKNTERNMQYKNGVRGWNFEVWDHSSDLTIFISNS